jgi:hypothetical protein
MAAARGAAPAGTDPRHNSLYRDREQWSTFRRFPLYEPSNYTPQSRKSCQVPPVSCRSPSGAVFALATNIQSTVSLSAAAGWCFPHGSTNPPRRNRVVHDDRRADRRAAKVFATAVPSPERPYRPTGRVTCNPTKPPGRHTRPNREIAHARSLKISSRKILEVDGSRKRERAKARKSNVRRPLLGCVYIKFFRVFALSRFRDSFPLRFS